MKKLLILLFSLFFLSSPSVFANNLIYHCDLDTTYKISDSKKWKNKFISYTFTSNNDTIEIYDHEINVTYPLHLNINLENSQLLIAESRDSVFFETLVINKENSFATYAISAIDASYAGSYSEGKCYMQ